MMKFIQQNLENIEGVATYPLFSLILFFVFFLALFFEHMLRIGERIIGIIY